MKKNSRLFFYSDYYITFTIAKQNIMRTQILYGLKFHYVNFDYELARNLLSYILRKRFKNISKDTWRFIEDKTIVSNLKLHYPEIENIELFVINEDKENEDFLINKIY